jgi:Chemoreceptor zinc-binding domain
MPTKSPLCFFSDGKNARLMYDLYSDIADTGISNRIFLRGDIMDLDEAMLKHAQWKIKFRAAMEKKEVMDVQTISKDNCCDLGKWLASDGKRQLGALNSFSECCTKHTAFHVEAGRVATLINEKKYTEAEKMLGPGSRYGEASNAVALAITKLKKEVKG